MGCAFFDFAPVKLLDRYVLKEHAGPLVFALSALTALMLLNYIAKQFANLVGKGLPWSVIGEFFLLALPFTLAMTLPMAVLVATIYATSRLASENEVTAMKASGVDLAVVLRPVLASGAVIAGLMILFNDQVLPRANHRLRQLQTDIARKKPTFGLREQIINEISQGQLYLRANRIAAESNRMHEVVIYDLADPLHRRTVYADSGDLAMSADRRDLVMTLYHGYMQELSRQTPGEMQRVFYSTNNVRVKGIGNTLERSTTDDGYRGDREQSICELQSQVQHTYRDAIEARERLSAEMVNTVRVLTRGRPSARPDTLAVQQARRRSLGTIYCAIVDGVLPKTASAQSGTSVQDAGAANSAVIPATYDQPVVYIETLASQVESHRIRYESAQQGVDGYEVEIEKKFALSVACLVFVLFGAPIALRFPRGGVGLTLGVSLVVFSLYYVGLIAGESLADRGVLSPFVAMWTANGIFSVIGLSLWRGVGREQTSARGGGLTDWWHGWQDRRRAARRARVAQAAGGAVSGGGD